MSSNGDAIHSKLAEKISGLSEDRQWTLLQQLIEGNLAAVLHELISKMSHDEQLDILAQLQTQPINSDNPEETEIALRSHSRKSCMISTDYVVEGHNFEGFMLDISPAGAFIETSETFTAGQQIRLSFALPDFHQQLNISGEILWKGILGIGVKFNGLSPDQITAIESFIEDES